MLTVESRVREISLGNYLKFYIKVFHNKVEKKTKSQLHQTRVNALSPEKAMI